MNTLYPHQTQLSDAIHKAWDDGARVVMASLATGGGKCLAPGTPVLLYDGRITPVECVCEGMLLMGPDSKPRTVLSTCKGRDEMYVVRPVKGDSYTVNSAHILSLRRTRKRQVDAHADQVVNVCVTDFIKSHKTFKHLHKGWRCGVDFPSQEVPPLDPYFLGLWLGDGTSVSASVTTADAEVISYLIDLAAVRGLHLRVDRAGGKSNTFHFSHSVKTGRGATKNTLLADLRSLEVLSNKHIPLRYRAGSRHVRLETLAGLLDSDGHYTGKGYDFISKLPALAEGVCFLARSLGLAAYQKECWKSCNGQKKERYFRVHVSGEVSVIPCRVERKKAKPRMQIKSVLKTGLTVTPAGIGDYYGFEISGDGLFLLGDFTVTHNTVVFCDTVRRLGVPTCVIAHRSELVAQASLTLARNGIPHRVIGPQSLSRECAALHAQELGTMLVSPRASTAVAGVDTLVKRADALASWCATVRLVVQDEGHHVLRDNKWGKAFSLFPNARGLFVTATPIRADGAGLGAHADGLADRLVIGPGPRELIRAGFLTDYRVIAPPSDIDYSHIPVTSTGDLSLPQLRETVHKSRKIVGDVVKHYLKFAAGQRGITFAVDVEAATEIAAAYRQAGVPAEALSGKTPTALRYEVLRRFSRGEVLQLVNCDLFGEGFDVPACSVVSMVRRTESYPLYAQQRGRMMRIMIDNLTTEWGKLTNEQRTQRIAASDKPNGILLDHVGNFARHAAQDAAQAWSLDRRERRSRGETETIPTRTCGNVECFSVYERWRKACPYCGWVWTPAERSTPEAVDGDLTEIDPAVLARLYGESARLVGEVVVPYGMPHVAALGLRKQHTLRAEEQRALRSVLATWAGWQKHLGLSDSEIYRRFWLLHGTDIATVQTFGARDAAQLRERLEETLNREGVIADEMPKLAV